MATVPSTPILVTIKSLNASLFIAFTPPSNDGGSAIVDYEYSLNGGDFISAGTTVSPYVIPGLTNGTVYTVRIRAINSVGPGAISAPLTGTPGGVPGVPTINSITVNPRSDGYFTVSISYTAPAENGGKPITAYWLTIRDEWSAGEPYNINVGLANPIVRFSYSTAGGEWTGWPAAFFGANYRFRMHAVNDDGAGPFSDYAYVTPESTYYSATRTGPTTVRISFNPELMPSQPKSVSASDLGDALRPNTWPCYYVAPDGTSSVRYPTSVNKINAYIFDLNGISDDTFTYISTAETYLNTALQLQDSSRFKVGIASLDYTPTAPVLVSATPGIESLTFTVTPPPVPPPYGLSMQYEIISTPSGSSYSFYKYKQVTLNGSNQFTITGLTDGVPHTFQIRAYVVGAMVTQINRAFFASPWSTALTAIPGLYPTPAFINSILPSVSSLLVHYSSPASSGSTAITGYEYNINGGSYISVDALNPFLNPFVITGLTGGTPYTVRVRARNSLGPGQPSYPATETPLVPEPRPNAFYAIGERAVRVQFSSEILPAAPLHQASTGAGDALNPRTWQITRYTPEYPAGEALTTMSVVMGADAYTYDILTLEPFTSANAPDLLLTASGLKLENGATYPVSQNFSGTLATTEVSLTAKSVQRGIVLKDIANASISPVKSLIGGDYSEYLSGTLVINSSGDYASMAGESLVRKLITRRILSQKGDFFHLPNYGSNLQVNGTFSTRNMRQTAKDLEMQVMQEPEIEAAKVTLTYQAAASILLVQVQARMRSTGQNFAVSVNVPVGSVQF